jgi:nitrate/nitrite transport system substrate-binding protein
VDAAQHAAKAKNRKEISAAIAPTNRLDQPIPVIERALTRRHADGPGNIMNVPDRIDFDPFPWHFMGVRTLIQLKRLGGIEGDVDCRGVAVRVCLAGDSAKSCVIRAMTRRASPANPAPSWARPSTRRRPRLM